MQSSRGLPDGVTFGHGSSVAWVRCGAPPSSGAGDGPAGAGAGAGVPVLGWLGAWFPALLRGLGRGGPRLSDHARIRRPRGVAMKPAASRRGPMGEVRAEVPFTRSTVTVPREPARAAAARASAAGRRRGSSRGLGVPVGGPGQQGLAAALHVERSARRRRGPPGSPPCGPVCVRLRWVARAREGRRRTRSRGRRRPGRRLGGRLGCACGAGRGRSGREGWGGRTVRCGRRGRRRCMDPLGRSAVLAVGVGAELGRRGGGEGGQWAAEESSGPGPWRPGSSEKSSAGGEGGGRARAFGGAVGGGARQGLASFAGVGHRA